MKTEFYSTESEEDFEKLEHWVEIMVEVATTVEHSHLRSSGSEEPEETVLFLDYFTFCADESIGKITAEIMKSYGDVTLEELNRYALESLLATHLESEHAFYNN